MLSRQMRRKPQIPLKGLRLLPLLTSPFKALHVFNLPRDVWGMDTPAHSHIEHIVGVSVAMFIRGARLEMKRPDGSLPSGGS